MSASYNLWEVITDNAAGRAFGMTFHNDGTARAYARAMRRLGYTAETSPVFHTEPNLDAALESAARFYDDSRITKKDSD